MRRAGADWASSPREGAWRLLQLLSVEEMCIERLHLAAVHVSNSRYGPDWGHACHPGHARHPCIVSNQQTVAQLLVWGEGGSECAPRSSVLTCTLMALLDLDRVLLCSTFAKDVVHTFVKMTVSPHSAYKQV